LNGIFIIGISRFVKFFYFILPAVPAGKSQLLFMKYLIPTAAGPPRSVIFVTC